MRNGTVLNNKTWSAKRLVVVLAILLALSACLALPGVYADEVPGETETGGDGAGTAEETTGAAANKKTSTVNDLRDSLSGVRDELDNARSEYDQAVDEVKSLGGQIAVLEEQIIIKEEEINATQAQINKYSDIIFDLSVQILELDDEVFNQNSALNKRLRIMYETGDQSVLAVLLGSESFVDFLSNIEMVRRIHESDKAFLIELEKKLDDLELKKEEVKQIEGKLKEERAALQIQMDQLEADKDALAAARQRMKEIRDKWAAEVDRLEKESKRIEQELVNMTSQWGDYAGGAMAWPVLGPITSEFGGRIHPITGRWTMHNGIDIGVPTGTPVHAAADGVIYSAGWNSGGYGNLVMIDNGMLDGKSIFTLYAHNSGFAVSKGTVVHRGDIIAYAGSTGNSTGPHVHFEVRVNGTPQNPRGWLG